MLKLSISRHFFWKNIAQKNQRTLGFFMQLGKNTQSYGHTGRKTSTVTTSFYNCSFWMSFIWLTIQCQIWKKIWIVHPFTLLDRAIFVWPWKVVSARFVISFISQWMKISKHGPFVFPTKKTHCSIGQSCCSMTWKRSIGWFFFFFTREFA